MRVIYVAGPYRAASEWAVVDNIRRAEAIALEVWRMGAVALCPHKNTAFFGGAVPDARILDGDLELVRRCDAVMTVYGWDLSEGARAEVELARELELPVFENLFALSDWLLECEAAPAGVQPREIEGDAGTAADNGDVR